MNTSALTNNYRVILWVLGIVFFSASVWAYYSDDPNFFVYRFLRGCICFVFLMIVLLSRGKAMNQSLFAFLFLYSLSGFFTVWYENNTMATLAMATGILSYSFLIWNVFPKVSFRKMTPLLAISGTIMILVNGYLVYMLVDKIQGFALSELHYAFVILNAATLFTAGCLAFLYNHVHSTRASLVFMAFVLFIIFSEVMRAIAYYDFAYGNIPAFVARGLMIIGLSFLVVYTNLKKQASEQLNPRIF